MASYGYPGGGGGGGANYSTTTYGAQGGTDGGGFMPTGYGGSQTASQETPGAQKTYGKETLRPVTVMQIINAQLPHPDSEFKIDGTDVTQLTFVGQIHAISPQATNITYVIDDGTGLIDVKQWIDSDADPESAKASLKEGQYVRVWGRLKVFNEKRHIGAHVLRPVVDFNEIQYHLLEATAVHLYFTKGMPEGTNLGIKSESGDGMFVDNFGGNAANEAQAGGARKPLPNLTPVAKKVFALLKSAPQNNEGFHVHNISQQLTMPLNDVFKAGDELLGNGLIYTTIDDETWGVLEY